MRTCRILRNSAYAAALVLAASSSALADGRNFVELQAEPASTVESLRTTNPALAFSHDDRVLLSDGISTLGLRGPGPCALSGGNCQPRNLAPPAGTPLAVFSQSTNNFAAAESFTGSGNATSVCWWGIYFNGGAPFAQPGNDSFTITYYSDAGGVPGAVLGGPFFVQIGSGLTTAATGETVGAALFPVYEFSATHAAVALNGCTWVQIVNTTVTGTERFGWMTSGTGNQFYAQDGDTTTPWGVWDQETGTDLSFCSNANTGGACGSVAAPAPVCTLTQFVQCQDAQAPGAGDAYLADGIDQAIADDFRVTANTTLSQICWKGVYGGSGEPIFDAFQITIFNDANGQPGTILGQWAPGDPNIAITRGFDGPSGFGIARFDYTASITGGPTLLATGCYWIEILNLVGTPWYWFTADPGTSRVLADGLGGSPVDGYNVADFLTADMAFCVSGTLNQGQGCNPNINIPANDFCSNAIVLSLGTPVNGFTSIDAQPGSTTLPRPDGPPCGFNLDDRFSVWYRFNNGGTAQSITASTCDAATNFDTVIDIYCVGNIADPCNTLNCVANNDTSACGLNVNRAIVEWFAQADTAYYIRVHGRAGAVGAFNIALTAGGAATTSTCVACNLTSEVGDVLETEACGADTNGVCNGAGVQLLNFGDVAFGNTFSHNGTRNFDHWRYNLPVGNYTFNIVGQAEFPVLWQVLHYGTLASCGGLGGWQVNVATCAAVSVDGPVLANTTGAIFVRVIPGSGPGGLNDFFGMPCEPNATWTSYRFSLSTNTEGACCIGTACSIGTIAECAFLGGTFQGNGTTCTPDPCGGAPATGACCLGSLTPPAPGACAIFTAAQCATAGGSYQGDGSTCTGLGYTNDVGSNNPTPPVNPAFPYAAQPGCCRANINGATGVTVQDLYDYFTAWSAYNAGQLNLNPLTDINNSGTTTVQDLYDFLTIWNQGCPPLP